MSPPEATNFDIVMLNSVTPSANVTWNLGQNGRRYLYIYTEFVRCNRVVFDAGSTSFWGSYNELRDRPTIPSAVTLPSWVNTTQNLVSLSGFKKDLTWLRV